MIYDSKIPSYGSLMTVQDFKERVEEGLFIDYDGYGYPCKDGRCVAFAVYPSQLKRDLPPDATHIVWFNR